MAPVATPRGHVATVLGHAAGRAAAAAAATAYPAAAAATALGTATRVQTANEAPWYARMGQDKGPWNARMGQVGQEQGSSSLGQQLLPATAPNIISQLLLQDKKRGTA